jgi:ABC-type uncharacterized transport system permease subunit
MPGFTLNFITAALYGLAAFAAWQGILEVRSASPEGSGAPRRGAGHGMLRALCVTALAAHGWVLVSDLFAPTAGSAGLNIGFSHAVSLVAWLSFVTYVAIGFDHRLLRVAAWALGPFAAVAVLLPIALPAQRVVNFGGVAFKAHVVVAMMAYALFTVAAIHALFMLVLERRLHDGELPAKLQGMPPLLRLERLLFQLLLAAFVLLTATVISGVFFSEALFSRTLQLNHKTVFALFSWVLFGALLLGHWRYGWRGRLAIRWTLAGFVLLLLSYLGSKFVLEIILKRV